MKNSFKFLTPLKKGLKCFKLFYKKENNYLYERFNLQTIKEHFSYRLQKNELVLYK